MKTNLIGNTFTRVPNLKQREKKHKINEVKDFKRVREKTKKRIIKSGFYLCDKVQERLGDSKKYIEFLRLLYMYSKGVLDLTEFLNLVDDSVRADENLMNKFDDFLEHCEKSGNRFDLDSLGYST
ncbi:hypothetical protein M0R45_020417 [Rubus argutus]|uniref:Uncharacterized protein n=1 Tax=Rubus argutus TaxID=59490 RepID=A0AAW1X9M7_RUBAR